MAADSGFVPDDVKVIRKSYLSRSFESKEWSTTIDDVSTSFSLNEEQNRAFRIVANHACSPDSEQLRMYIAGMAGAGKSQVLKALIEFFARKKQSHRLMVLAPTGSAAALLGGSTYHSTLGINSEGGRTSNVQLAQVKSKLEGVDYIFLDEVSMLSCRDLYLISARLARALNNPDTPFGGMNMIFAGDFAQLPPVIGQQHAALYSRTVGNKPTSLSDQEAAIGKALWHQVTTVVVLRKNMRQQNQSPDDAQFRQALANMRYKACTPEDITFLRSRISSSLPGRPNVNEKRFRNVSIITRLNAIKDEINRLGSIRFAAETNQQLHDFYSIDSIPSDDQAEIRVRNRRVGRKKRVGHSRIPDNIQKVLWEQPPCSNTKLIPGKLSLCIGMPVMIRNNAATELCITKGQEAVVCGWKTVEGVGGRSTLDTLFVKLLNPPSPVQFDGLQENVVPLTRSSVTTSCSLPDDSSITISRSQVEVLPNFAMTDYASQGKTRLNNVVDLSYTLTHQGYYTALSRGVSASGTLILGGIHPSKITGGASGILRQEFRELEILDDITTHRFQNKLPRKVAMGERRNALIALFREYKGTRYAPSEMHIALRWSKRDPYLEWEDNGEWHWKLVDRAAKKSADLHLAAAKDGGLPNNLKRRASHDPLEKLNIKKPKTIHSNAQDGDAEISPGSLVPIGTQWQNNSCAYDAVCTILFNIWRAEPAAVSLAWSELENDLLNSLITSFDSHVSLRDVPPSYSLEQIRDYLRRRMARMSEQFAYGQYTGVHAVVGQLLATNKAVMLSRRSCGAGHELHNFGDERISDSCQILTPHGLPGSTLQQSMDDFALPLSAECPMCRGNLHRLSSFVWHPPLLGIELWDGMTGFDSELTIEVGGSRHAYSLRGVIYYAGEHFTARVVTKTGMVWYHDGIFTGSSLVYESGVISSVPRENAIIAVYTRN
jgi:hypothetical protein